MKKWFLNIFRKRTSYSFDLFGFEFVNKKRWIFYILSVNFHHLLYLDRKNGFLWFGALFKYMQRYEPEWLKDE